MRHTLHCTFKFPTPPMRLRITDCIIPDPQKSCCSCCCVSIFERLRRSCGTVAWAQPEGPKSKSTSNMHGSDNAPRSVRTSMPPFMPCVSMCSSSLARAHCTTAIALCSVHFQANLVLCGKKHCHPDTCGLTTPVVITPVPKLNLHLLATNFQVHGGPCSMHAGASQ